MKRSIKILPFMLLYFLLSGRSCVPEDEILKHQEFEADKAKDSIRQEFEADYLTEEARYATEVNAIRKLNDLADYVNIYADQSLDSLFRDKAGEMIRGLFVSDDVKLSFGAIRKKEMQLFTIEEFLEDGFGKEIPQARIIFDSVKISEPLKKSGAEDYSGKLQANQTVYSCNNADSVVFSSSTVIIEFYSSRQVKMIGSDTLKVWSVRLGEMH